MINIYLIIRFSIIILLFFIIEFLLKCYEITFIQNIFSKMQNYKISSLSDKNCLIYYIFLYHDVVMYNIKHFK